MANNTIADATVQLAAGTEKAVTAIDSLSNAGFKNSKILESMAAAGKSASGAIGDLFGSFSKLAGGLDLSIFQSINSALTSAVTIAANVADGYDSIDEGLRGFGQEQFRIAGSIGATFEESEKFVRSYREIIKANSELSRDGLYIGSDDVKETIKTLQTAGISIDDLSKKVEVFGVKMSYAQAMAAQAKAMGMTIADYDSKIAAMVRKSGLSMDDSMKLMAASQDIARDTGLTVDEVTKSLDGASSGFQRMGTTMDFGRPILRGFAESVKDVGLGIAQAGDLASEFSKSLINIVNNPALAYITSLKGGLSTGTGGGVLNPSIQMQSKMMDQTPGAQAELARSLSAGMRDTLKSFTGSDIITVKKAAESPELQTKFYTQQQMLGSTFGISDTMTQNRVLEYLEKLEEATYAGDDEMAAGIEKQIQETLSANDKTFSLQEKMSQSMEKTVILLQDQAQILKLQFTQQLKAAGLTGDSLTKQLRSFDKEISKGVIKYDEQAGDELIKTLVGLDASTRASADKTASIPPATQGPDSGAQIGTSKSTGSQGVTNQIGGTLNIVITQPQGMEANVTYDGLGSSPGNVTFRKSGSK